MGVAGTYEATRRTVGDLCRRFGRPRILDVGCGDGRLLAALAPFLDRGYGIDVSEEAVSAARRRSAGAGNLSFRVASVERLPRLGPTRFDLVLFVGSLEHMDDPELALDAARRHLRAGGRIVVVAISPRAPHAVISRWMLRRSENPVVAHLGVAGLRRVAPRAGLRVEAVQPLRRGTAPARSPAGRGERIAGGLLALYDRVGGPTCAVVLAVDALHETGGPGADADARPGRA